MSNLDTDTLVIGAGPAGLAVAACLRRAAVPFVVLERDDRVGAGWHRHYERLHLHTDKGNSALPFVPFSRQYPRYPSRLEVIGYLEDYARQSEIRPVFGQEATLAHHEDGRWLTRTQDHLYVSRRLVIATGYNCRPVVPTWPDQDAFAGPIVHSSAYRNGEPYRSQRTLVVGFGNSGGEIALDLWEHDARPSLAVRGAVNIIPREILGVPILSLAILLGRLPPSVTDRLNALILRTIVGSYGRLGLRQAAEGPLTQIARRRRIPLIDVGTVRLIRAGQVAVYPGVERFTARGVCFTDGRDEPFDAVILATGYRPALADFLADAERVLDQNGNPRSPGARTALPGLYVCGFNVVATGMLREIAREAKTIAREISRETIPIPITGQAETGLDSSPRVRRPQP
jgi:indole-3-pyruvate monooxygenase